MPLPPPFLLVKGCLYWPCICLPFSFFLMYKVPPLGVSSACITHQTHTMSHTHTHTHLFLSFLRALLSFNALFLASLLGLLHEYMADHHTSTCLFLFCGLCACDDQLCACICHHKSFHPSTLTPQTHTYTKQHMLDTHTHHSKGQDNTK